MTQLLSVDGWAALEQEIHERFGVSAHAYDAGGSPFTGHVTWGNRLCPSLRKSKTAAGTICAVVNQAVAAEVRASGEPAVTDCDAGLMVVCVPVVVDGTMIGMVGGCGGLCDGSEPETFLIEKTSGLTEEQTAELCTDMRRYTADEAQNIAAWIEARVADIVKNHESRRAL
jgi:ligand-binding sensor protein